MEEAVETVIKQVELMTQKESDFKVGWYNPNPVEKA